MNFLELLVDLSKQIGMQTPLKPDDNGVCRLVFDGKYPIDLEAPDTGQSIYLYATVGGVPPQPELKNAVYELLLSANLFGRGTGEACFALDPEQEEILLIQVLRTERTDATELVRVLEQFVGYLVSWQEKLLNVETTLKEAGVEFKGKAAGSGHGGSGMEGDVPPDGGMFLRA